MGWHTIISMQSGVNFYTNRGMKKVRPIIKSKELLFDSVAWNQHNSNESSTQEILIGTNDGLIFETILTSDEGRFITNTTEQYWRQVANLGHSVTGLEVVRHPPGSACVLVGEPQRCVILATTPSRLYQFAGWINTSSTTTLLSQLASGSPPSSTGTHLSANLGLPAMNDYPQTSGVSATPTLFPNYAPGLYYNVFNPEEKLPAGSKVTEFPHSFGYSDLKLYKFPGDELPSRFAWMTGPGIYFGHLKTEQLNLPPFSMPPSEVGAVDSSLSAVDDPTDRSSNRVTMNGQNTTQPRDVFAGRVVNLFRKTKLLPYPVIRMLEHTGVPLGICLTAFHVIVAYADRVKAVNILDDQTVFSMPITPELNGGRALGVCRDPSSGIVWFFSNQGVALLNIRNETCRVWQIYLDRMLFDEARKFCQTESQLDTVNMREAEHCFSHGDFMNSAKLFARTSVPFEEVALRFSQLSLMQQQACRASSPPVLQGLAVKDDLDVMDAIIHGSDEAKKSSKLPLLNGSKSVTELTISASAPLKTLVSTKLQQLIEQKSVPLTGNAGIPSAKQSAPTKHTSISGQITLLSLWLAELLITEISFFRDRLEKHDSSQDGSRLETASEEFRRLLATPEVLAILPDAKDLLYDLIESHGGDAEIVFLAELLGDHPRLVTHYMRLGMHKDALRTLGASSRCISLVYEYSTTLALSCPEDVVTVWLRLGKLLDPVKLLPAIMLLPPKHAMRYLQTAVERYGCTDQAVHHLLISLCAEASSPLSNQAPESADSKDYLMSYLESASAHALNMVDAAGHSQFSLQELMSTTLSSEASDEPNSLLMGFDTSFMQSLGTRAYGGGFRYARITLSVIHTLTSVNFLLTDKLTFQLPLDKIRFSVFCILNVFHYSRCTTALPYDPGFVLRTCKETGHLQGTVFILKLLGMHQQALQTAIDSLDM
ncbi:Pep3/Vps18/deep orange family protein, partial [Opisthorchis viverrini]